MEFYEMDEGNRIRTVCKWVVDVVLVISFAWFLVYAFGTQVRVSGNSMQPALNSGDVVLMNRLSCSLFWPGRMDVVVFAMDAREENIKRVVGLPGETIQIQGGLIYINGVALENEDGLGQTALAGLAQEPISLGEDEYFLLGDNGGSSEDSRFSNVGNIKREQIKGRVWLKISPITDFGLVSS